MARAQRSPQGQRRLPAGSSEKKAHLLSKKARTILDRIGLSSRSGTLLKFSLLGPRKNRHREKREKRKQGHTVACHRLAGPAGTGQRQDQQVPPWPVSSSTAWAGRSRQGQAGAGSSHRLRGTRQMSWPCASRKIEGCKNCTPFREIGDRLWRIVPPGRGTLHGPLRSQGSRLLAWRFGKPSGRSPRREGQGCPLPQRFRSLVCTQERGRHVST